MLRLFKLAAAAALATLTVFSAEARNPMDTGDCPPGAWCHPNGSNLGGLGPGGMGFMSDSDADAIGNALSSWKCNPLAFEGCLAKVLNEIQCWGPQGELRTEMCKLRDANPGGGSGGSTSGGSGGGGEGAGEAPGGEGQAPAGGGGNNEEEPQPEVYITDNGTVVSGLRSARLKNQVWQSLLKKKDWAKNPNILCDERGRCWCPVVAGGRRDKSSSDFAIACESKEYGSYQIVGQGDLVMVVKPSPRRR